MGARKKTTAARRPTPRAVGSAESPLAKMFRLAMRLLTGVLGEADSSEPKPPRARRARPSVETAAPTAAHPVAAAMLSYAPSPMLSGPRPKRSEVKIFPRPSDVKVKLSQAEEANAFLFAIMFDHMIKADLAWVAPHYLAERLGHLDIARIAKMTEHDIGLVLKKSPGRKGLHRLWPRLAKNILGVSAILEREYGGSAENIWPDGTDISVLSARLRALPGLGPKLTSMTIRLLVEHHGRTFVDWRKADVAVDRHVARVFLRTGLVGGGGVKRVYSVSELHDDVIRAGREAYPHYPAALDYPAFEVGRSHCHAVTPNCPGCPLRKACPQDRKTWRIG